MVEPKKEDESLNFEALSLEELGRTPVSEAESGDSSEMSTSELQGPSGSRRCESSKRELLKNSFPVDE